jgi:hypothetical protein
VDFFGPLSFSLQPKRVEIKVSKLDLESWYEGRLRALCLATSQAQAYGVTLAEQARSIDLKSEAAMVSDIFGDYGMTIRSFLRGLNDAPLVYDDRVMTSIVQEAQRITDHSHSLGVSVLAQISGMVGVLTYCARAFQEASELAKSLNLHDQSIDFQWMHDECGAYKYKCDLMSKRLRAAILSHFTECVPTTV